ncbi:hypothetical protein MNB_SM-3-910 [hydrothermal vent metagenome]|uniref:Chemotaxis phosphatase CheX-like domain-containing protein n=1 Tax=hydrothermal vent metagenome TaxID=652676 RepID=A0A1W1D310_9ZZZZ
MLETIVEAAKNFCIHQIDLVCKDENATIKDDMIITYITINQNDKKYKISIAYNFDIAQHIAKLFLEEDTSDKETLIDMSLESTNLIVGSAKVLAENSGEHFLIDTPNFVAIQHIKQVPLSKTLQKDNYKIFIAIEKIDE